MVKLQLVTSRRGAAASGTVALTVELLRRDPIGLRGGRAEEGAAVLLELPGGVVRRQLGEAGGDVAEQLVVHINSRSALAVDERRMSAPKRCVLGKQGPELGQGSRCAATNP